MDRDGDPENHRPESEHHFDLAEKMQHLAEETHLIGHAVLVPIRLALRLGALAPPRELLRRVPLLDHMGLVPDRPGEKRVQDGDQEDAGRDQVKRLRRHPAGERGPKARALGVGIGPQGPGKSGVRCADGGERENSHGNKAGTSARVPINAAAPALTLGRVR